MENKSWMTDRMGLCYVERGISMIRILICDDDPVALENMQNCINKVIVEMDIKAKIHPYKSMEEIGIPILSSCDIAFLDIDFRDKKYTGIDIAKKLRSLRKDAVIIFSTNYIEYAPIGYELQAFRYMLKEEMQHKLEVYLKAAIIQLNSLRETIKIQNNGEIIDIVLQDILYIESQQHTLVVHCLRKDKKPKEYRFYGSLASIEEQLESRGFLRIHKSFLVNMRHLVKFQCKEAMLDNGIVLRVSEKNYSQQKKKYLCWKGR